MSMPAGEPLMDMDQNKVQEVMMERITSLQIENIQLNAALRQFAEINKGLKEEIEKLKSVLKSSNPTPSKDDTE